MISSFGRFGARNGVLAIRVYALIAFLALAALLHGTAHAARPVAPQFSVIHYEPVSKVGATGQPSNRQLYDYTYTVHIQNSSAAPAHVSGVVSTKLGSLSLIDAEASFGVVAKGGVKASVDTITIRANKNFDRRLDPKELKNGRWQLVEPGRDKDDDQVPGLPKEIDDWRDEVANAFYDLKFQHFFNWTLVTRPDVAVPSISNLLPQGNQSTAQPTISASYADSGSGINPSGVSLKLDGVDVSAKANKTGTSISYQPAAPLSQGVHTAILSVTDKGGNSANATWSFTVDTVAPSITNQSPSNTSTTNPGAVISAQYADTNGTGVDVATVRMLVDGVDVTAAAVKTVSGISYTPPVRLANGSHSVALTLKDMAGNTAAVTWSFGVAGTAPTVRNITPANNSYLSAGMPQTIGAQFVGEGAGINLQTVRLELDGQNVTAQAQVTANGITLMPAQALGQGLHKVNLTVADTAGNVATQSWAFTVDTIAPVVSSQSPSNTANANPASTIAAQYSDQGGSGIEVAGVKLLVDNVDVTATAVKTESSISYTPAAGFAPGEHTVLLTLQDKAGNTTTATWTFGVDGTGPVTTSLTPEAGASLAADAIPTIAAVFQDSGAGVNASKTVLEVDDENVTAQAQITAEGISFTPAQALVEGPHNVKLTLVDNYGNVSVQTWGFVTATAPVISGQTPSETFLPGGATPSITASFNDVGRGIDPAQTKLFFNGVDVTSQAVATAGDIRYEVTEPLADSTHTVKLLVADLAGNTATSEWQFGTAQPPEITATSPKDTMLPFSSRPTITASYEDTRVGINPSSVRLIVNGSDVTSLAQVAANAVSYTPAQSLESGPYTVYLEVANNTNARVNAIWGFEVDEQKTYNLAITNPAAPQTVTVSKLPVTVNVQASHASPSRVVLNGSEMQIANVGENGVITYNGTADLIDGANTLNVQATFNDGEVHGTSAQVTYDAPPKVIITSPADRAMLGRANTSSPGNLTGNVERPVTITGRVNKPVQSVTINQQQATLLNNNTEFRFENFFLREGMNMLTAVATDISGRVGSAAIQVSVDQTAPILTIEAPVANAITSNNKIDVRGMVNDAVEAFVGAPEPQVTVVVNGVMKTAQVSDRYYLVVDVPLQIGENVLTVRAVDQFGNVRSQEIKVSRVAVGSDRLTLLGGNNQSAKSGTELAKPLTIVALNPLGEPLANLPISFDVVRGTGSISAIQGQVAKVDGVNPARNLVINTDVSGQAQVWLTTGKQSGVGANVVKVSNPRLSEDVTFTATTERGAVFKINADLGTNQFAETGGQPLELLSVVVRDREDNLLPNVPVVFAIEEGDAFFTDNLGGVAQSGGKRIVLNTDKNGLAALRPVIGYTPGTIRITAKALKEAGGNVENSADLTGNATFFIQAKEAKDGPAIFKGNVYTDKGLPLAGVRVSIGRTALASTTDEQGSFELVDVPPGRIDLFIDGRTVNPTNDPSRQQWPSLHFEVFAVKGQDNVLPHPIYLPPLLTSEAKTVGGNEDVILKMPGVEGFQMKVKANSVTFPDGSRTGTLVVSPVTGDRLPMAPPAGGATFGIPAWTIQPAGTRFDPPIEVQMPNARANPAGDNIPIVQWDHDLGQYVPMGRATVTEDGAFLVTDAGSGITKAGWGGACVYDPDKCAKNAPKCGKCEKLVQSVVVCPYCEFYKDTGYSEETSIELAENWSAEFNRVKSLLRRVGVTNLEGGFSFKISGAKQKVCCSEARPMSKKIQAQVAFEGFIESEFGVPGYSVVIPTTVTAVVPQILPTPIRGPGGDIVAGIFIKARGALGGAGSGDFDDCNNSGGGEAKATLEGALEGTVKVGYEVSGNPIASANLFTLGGSLGLESVTRDPFKPSCATSVKAKAAFYAKVEFTLFNYNSTVNLLKVEESVEGLQSDLCGRLAMASGT